MIPTKNIKVKQIKNDIENLSNSKKTTSKKIYLKKKNKTKLI